MRPITFVIMGNAGYYPLLERNIEHIREVYPQAPILVYDWGDAQSRPGFRSRHDVEIVDWTGRISDISHIQAQTPFDQQVALATAFNSRFRRTLGRRLKKKLLKAWPASPLARPLIEAGLRFENMLTQKVPCMMDASRRVGEGPMVFLDADAFLCAPVDDIYGRGDFDLTVTLIERANWNLNQCAVINSGVIFFNARQAARDAFLGAWNAAIGQCSEWLREQTALVRMLAAIDDTSLFTAGGSMDFAIGGETVRLRSVTCAEFNNTDIATARRGYTRIIHFANLAHHDHALERGMRQLAAWKAGAA